jgi:hypothetical protein
MLCCQGFEVKNYDFTLGRLAYENLRLVQNSGNHALCGKNHKGTKYTKENHRCQNR